MDTKGRRNSTITWSAEQQMYITTDLGLDLDTVRQGTKGGYLIIFFNDL